MKGRLNIGVLWKGWEGKEYGIGVLGIWSQIVYF
jgi:hypothetical protein